MNTLPPGVFHGSIIVHPNVDLPLPVRILDGFEIQSAGVGFLSARSSKPDAWNSFISAQFLQSLKTLSWDVLWECLIAVQFEPGPAKQGEVEHQDQKVIMMHLQDTISASEGNPKAGIEPYANSDLLQRIRDRIILKHLAAENSQRNAILAHDATLLVAVEHFIKDIVIDRYAFAEFYSVVETVENPLGGRHQLFQIVPKKEVDKITSYANQPQYDQRHAPTDATTVARLPPGAIQDAGSVAKAIIAGYVQRI